MKLNKKGFFVIEAMLITAVVVTVGAATFQAYQHFVAPSVDQVLAK